MSRFDSAVVCLGILLGAASFMLLPWKDSSVEDGVFLRFAPFGMRPASEMLAVDVLFCELLAVVIFTAGLIAAGRLAGGPPRLYFVTGVALAVLSMLLLPWERTEGLLGVHTNHWGNVYRYAWFFQPPYGQIYPDAPVVAVNFGRVALQIVMIGVMTTTAVILLSRHTTARLARRYQGI